MTRKFVPASSAGDDLIGLEALAVDASNTPTPVTGKVLDKATPVHVAVVNASGDQVSSFGGSSAAEATIGSLVGLRVFVFNAVGSQITSFGGSGGGGGDASAANQATQIAQASQHLSRSESILAQASNTAVSAADIAVKASNIAARAADITAHTSNTAASLVSIQVHSSNISARTNEIQTHASNSAARLADIQVHTSNIAGTISTTFAHGSRSIASSGSDIVLASNINVDWVVLQAAASNTGVIAVGGSGVTYATGVKLKAEDSLAINPGNLANIFVRGTVQNDVVTFVYGA